MERSFEYAIQVPMLLVSLSVACGLHFQWLTLRKSQTHAILLIWFSILYQIVFQLTTAAARLVCITSTGTVKVLQHSFQLCQQLPHWTHHALVHLKLVSVIGYLQPKALFYVQMAIVLFGLFTVCAASTTMFVLDICMFDETYRMLYPYLVIVTYAFPIGLMTFEFARLLYTFIVFQVFIRERQNQKALESHAFVNYILLISLLVDCISICLSMGLSMPTQANSVLASMHLSLSYFMIHFLNRLVLSKKKKPQIKTSKHDKTEKSRPIIDFAKTTVLLSPSDAILPAESPLVERRGQTVEVL